MTALSMVINNRSTSFTAGQTILEAAQASQIRIPTLCHLKGATSTGECRICVVEVQGARTLLAACSTPAAAGMIVQTDSPKVIKARKTVLEMRCRSIRPSISAIAAHQKLLHLRREPGQHRTQHAQSGTRAGRGRIHGMQRYFSNRNHAFCPRDLSGGGLERKRRHVHQQRTAHQPGPHRQPTAG